MPSGKGKVGALVETQAGIYEMVGEYDEAIRLLENMMSRPGDLGIGGLRSVEFAALANEAYLKLVRAGGIRCESRAHFLALCAQIMRRILADHARRYGFTKRGGNALRAPLDEVLLLSQARGIEVLALDEALDALARIDKRKSRVIEFRYFDGLSIKETAEVLEVSVDTVNRDFRMARVWLLAELTGKQNSVGS